MSLPPLMIDNSQPRNIPRTPSVQPQIDSAYGGLARGVAVLGAGLASAGQSLRNRREDDERAAAAADTQSARALRAKYLTRFGESFNGTVDSEGNAAPGWNELDYDSLDTPDGGAAKRLAAEQKKFLASEEYAALSPRAKQLFDPYAQGDYAELQAQALRIDSRNGAKKRAAASQAAAAASFNAVAAVPLDDDETFLRMTDRHAADLAVDKLGTEVLNAPDLHTGGTGTDTSRLRFRGGEAVRAVFSAETQKARDTMLAGRAARMINAAAAEPDLDRQESFLGMAETFAKTHVTDEKTLADVSGDASRIRAAALRKESRAALDALATGQEYAYEGHARREAAFKIAAPIIEKSRKKQAAALGREQAAELKARGDFIAAAVESGMWIGEDGEVQPLNFAQRRSLALDALEKNSLDIPRYASLKSKLDRIEKSGDAARYERISAEVTKALAPDIKTVFQNGAVSLADKEDPARVVSKYTVEERGMKTEPVTEMRGIPSGGFYPVQEADTGRTRTVPVVTRRKMELAARDIPRIISLLMEADKAQGAGLRRDLYGNPVGKHVKDGPAAYREMLLNDFADRQTSEDIDAKVAMARDAMDASTRAFRSDEARVLRAAAARPRPPADTGEEDDAEADDDETLWP